MKGLLDYQIPAVGQLVSALEKHHGALDGSDLGTGKTASALGVIRERKLPTLVVAPAIAETGWRRMGRHLDVDFSFLSWEMLRTGNTPFGQWEHPRPKKMPKLLRCEVCQLVVGTPFPCPHHRLGIHCVQTETPTHKYGKFIFHPAVKQLVFDEVHRGSALDSLNADMLLACRRQDVPTLSLSATVAESPLDLRALGAVLRLHNYLDFYRWAFARGCRKTPWAGWQFLVGEEKRREVMGALHAEIFPERGARVRISDLGDKFPEVKITAELYDLQEGGKIVELYSQMDAAIAVLNDAKVDDNVEHPLTTLLRARQEIELLMVPILVELTEDAKREGCSVALFVNFRQTVDELCRRLKTDCRVDGSQVGEAGRKRRQTCLDRFQGDASREIVCSEAAGNASIDLHDIGGKFPRLGLVIPGFSAQRFRQIMGRLRRQGAKSKAVYRALFVAGTPQEKVHAALVTKLDCLDRLNDGDLAEANLPMTRGKLSEIFSGQAE